MGIYVDRDAEGDDGGELQFDRGDIKRATVKRSTHQTLHWLIASNRGDVIDGDSVSDMGSYLGGLNIPRTHRAMETSIRRALHFQGFFPPGDVQVAVVPVGPNEADVTARIYGVFNEETVEDDEVGFDALGYLMPFGTGQLTKVS